MIAELHEEEKESRVGAAAECERQNLRTLNVSESELYGAAQRLPTNSLPRSFH